ncbi:MAG: hypothetical protein ACRC7N_10230 [Clostridium sp.]
MTYLQVITMSVGILFMLTFMFIGIWLFIIALKAYNQLCYKNYILEKIYQRISLNNTNSSEEEPEDEISDLNEIFEE